MNVLWPFLLSFIWAIYWYFSFFHIRTVKGAESNIFTWKLRAGQLFLKMLGLVRPSPRVSRYFWICNFSYPDTKISTFTRIRIFLNLQIFLSLRGMTVLMGVQTSQGKGSETARRFWVVLTIRNKSTTQNLKRQQSGFQLALEAKRQ